MKKKPLLSQERIDAILQTVPFPIFYSEDESAEQISSALYVEDIGENTPMMMPEYLDIVKENGDGSETIARYILVDAVSEYANSFPELNN